jgi:8-oxo-dGTP diphosphatase
MTAAARAVKGRGLTAGQGADSVRGMSFDGMNFDGAKIAVLRRGRVLALLRDDRAGIPFPGQWDLLGGGREGDESPLDCALREAREEAGLVLEPSWVTWRRSYPGPLGPRRWFFAARLPEERPLRLRLGDEGQALRWFALADFLARRDAVPHFQDRLRSCLDETGTV